MPTLLNAYAFRPGTMLSAIQRLGYTSGLQLCLDASDIDSYASGQTWTDVGLDHDFYRGTTSSAQASDPTHNGTPGGQSSSEYWSFDGADQFKKTTSNSTFLNSLSKNSAVFTFAGYGWWGGTGDSLFLFATAPAASSPGIFIRLSAGSTQFGFTCYNSGGIAFNGSAGATLSTGQWYFFGLTVDEGATTGSVVVNGTATSLGSVSYSSPSSSNPSDDATIGCVGSTFSPSGSRQANLAMWDVALTTTQLIALYDLTKSKFGLS